MSAVDYLMPSFGPGPFSSSYQFPDSPFLDKFNTDPSHEGLGLSLDHKLLSPYEEPPPSTQIQHTMAPPMTVSPSLLVSRTTEFGESRKRSMSPEDDYSPPPQPKRQDSRDSPQRPLTSYHRELAPASAPTQHKRFASASPATAGYVQAHSMRNAFSQSPFRGQTPLLDTHYGWGSFDNSNDLGSAAIQTPYSAITGNSTFTSSPGGMGSPVAQSMPFAPQGYTTGSERPHSYSGPSSLGFQSLFTPDFGNGGSVAFHKGFDFGSADAPRQKPQCWDHGCNGRQFSTFSNLLRHQRERAGTAAKAQCPRCHAKFTRTTAMKGHLSSGKCRPRRNSDLQ